MNATQSLEQSIRERAYLLWVQAGRPEGQSDLFWDRAREIELEARRAAREDRLVDIEEEDSFPASDPPSSVGIIGERRGS